MIQTAVCAEIGRVLPQIKSETAASIEDIRRRVSDATGYMMSGVGVLRGAKEAGIINIFPTRYTTIDGQSAINVIREDLSHETTSIKLMGISLGDFFLDRGVLNSCLAGVLEASVTTGVAIQALIVHPKSPSLKERARWEAGPGFEEEPRFFRSTTFIETDGAARISQDLCQKHRKCLEVRLYSQAPTACILITRRFAFIETYHYASRGSKVPLFQVQAGSPLYKTFEAHFDRIWGVSVPVDAYDPLKSASESAKAASVSAARP